MHPEEASDRLDGLHNAEQTAGDIIAQTYSITSNTLTNKYEAHGWLAIAEKEVLGYLLEEAARREHYQTLRRHSGEGEADLVNERGDVAVSLKLWSRHSLLRIPLRNPIDVFPDT